ncbi:hypothetical protein ACTXT7_008169 [Hymenolepis weldensis]
MNHDTVSVNYLSYCSEVYGSDIAIKLALLAATCVFPSSDWDIGLWYAKGIEITSTDKELLFLTNIKKNDIPNSKVLLSKFPDKR